jgi:hypothetical protein
MTAFFVDHPKYMALFAEALPYARLHLALDRQDGRHITDEDGWVNNIQAAYASTAILRSESIVEVAARHLRPANASVAA